MTREETIKNIKEHCYFANLIPQAKEALDVAIKALSIEPCEDCISRAEAIKALTEYRDDLGGLGLFQICEDSYIYEKRTATDCIEIIENLPSQSKPIKNIKEHCYLQEPKWIPVNERLPEDSGTYLITLKKRDGRK